MRTSRALGRAGGALVALITLGACELTEITLTTPADVIVAEVVLRAGASAQYAYLHRTGGRDGNARVFGAVIRVEDESTGRTLLYEVTADSSCVVLRQNQNTASLGTCYVAASASGTIRPGAQYALRINVENREMTARTQMPGTFQLLQPAAPACRLPPNQPLELVWTRAEGAWVYVTGALFVGLREALRRQGVQVSGGNTPVELTGLSIGGADTTLIFPGELGLFDRFDPDIHPIALAIQDGLPADVNTELTIGAADRNYVNWVRGGTFNPSGQVRIPSIQGEGTGVFGSVVPLQRGITTRAGPPPCN